MEKCTKQSRLKGKPWIYYKELYYGGLSLLRDCLNSPTTKDEAQSLPVDQSGTNWAELLPNFNFILSSDCLIIRDTNNIHHHVLKFSTQSMIVRSLETPSLCLIHTYIGIEIFYTKYYQICGDYVKGLVFRGLVWYLGHLMWKRFGPLIFNLSNGLSGGPERVRGLWGVGVGVVCVWGKIWVGREEEEGRRPPRFHPDILDRQKEEEKVGGMRAEIELGGTMFRFGGWDMSCWFKEWLRPSEV